ncbi:hypothetical protein KIPB_013350 [Kipferlia bialata]|uniref:Uncharacterized protein n=1 Tax=Kipferlia bialata TaxID=797122 RepID=A0A9K3GQ30_9EUKA|nr:hypothetical protein KIPB_013350 [Kipferlia bialata]|eukprot:g13350.t1
MAASAARAAAPISASTAIGSNTLGETPSVVAPTPGQTHNPSHPPIHPVSVGVTKPHLPQGPGAQGNVHMGGVSVAKPGSAPVSAAPSPAPAGDTGMVISAVVALANENERLKAEVQQLREDKQALLEIIDTQREREREIIDTQRDVSVQRTSIERERETRGEL